MTQLFAKANRVVYMNDRCHICIKAENLVKTEYLVNGVCKFKVTEYLSAPVKVSSDI